MASLSDADKDRVRYHLEYPMLTSAVSTVASVVMHSDIRLVLENQMDNVSPTITTYVQKCLNILDKIETQMEDAFERMQVLKADVVQINNNEESDLMAQYQHWRNRLCNLLAVTVNPFALSNGGNSINFKR